MSIFDYGYASSNGKPALSNSQIQTYLTCSIKANALYGPDEDERLDVPLALNASSVGVILHHILENHLESPNQWLEVARNLMTENSLLPDVDDKLYYQHYAYVAEKLASKPWLKAPSYGDRSALNLFKQIKGQSAIDTYTPLDFLDALFVGIIKATGMDLFRKYGACDRERKLAMDRDDLPWVLTGTADLFYHVPGEGIFIGDYKTGNTGWSQSKLRNSAQFNHYALLARHMLNEPASTPVTVSVIAVKHAEVITTKLYEEDQNRYRRYLNSVLTNVKAIMDGEQEVIPSAGDLGCPCEVAAMGRCPYKVKGG